MKEKDSGLKHRDLTQKIIGVFYEVYNELGHGFGLKPEFKRLVYDNTRKKRESHPDLLTTLLTANGDFSDSR